MLKSDVSIFHVLKLNYKDPQNDFFWRLFVFIVYFEGILKSGKLS